MKQNTKLILLYRTHKTNKQYSNRSFIYKQMQMLVVVDENVSHGHKNACLYQKLRWNGTYIIIDGDYTKHSAIYFKLVKERWWKQTNKP